MNNIIFLILGMMIGGTFTTFIMCMLQINRIDEIENKYKKINDNKIITSK